ncbi:MAG: hypothetical protein MUO17_04485 [Dehalococcoidales bacterium]|nr:hypothetical protein [Dehalococcoidales bacterium]
MIVGKDKGLFRFRTTLGGCFQISEFKIVQMLKNFDQLREEWPLPIVDGREYNIQPKGFTWKSGTLMGWRLLQILEDEHHLQKQLSSDFGLSNSSWEHIYRDTEGILSLSSGQHQLCDTISTVIREHGRPMFRDIIAAMVNAKDPQFSEHAVYNILSTHSLVFQRRDVGIYGLRPDRSLDMSD